MDVILRLTDEELTLISIFMEMGLYASEDFNKVDYEAWGIKKIHRKKAEHLMKELDKAVIYEYIVKTLGVE